jgi:hypothetical protein
VLIFGLTCVFPERGHKGTGFLGVPPASASFLDGDIFEGDRVWAWSRELGAWKPGHRKAAQLRKIPPRIFAQ